ncbi:MAG: prolyl oligopeptidase family serine peptidase, partial [Bacteroidota bacterium]
MKATSWFLRGVLAVLALISGRIQAQEGEYTAVINGYDWGCAVSHVVLPLEEEVSGVNRYNYQVTVKRHHTDFALSPAAAEGERLVTYAYVSDAEGNKQPKGKHITLLLNIGPQEILSPPIQYLGGLNRWVDYQMTITNTATKQVWGQEANRILPEVDRFDLTGRFEYEPGKEMSYAAFSPETDQKKVPLIIWLHGGGEGGTDPAIPLLANRATNYAGEDIQHIFGGAYVLVPQSPTFWMQKPDGQPTWGNGNDRWNEHLMDLIRQFVTDNPNIDQDRIYVGGCSNGGYMSIKLLLLHPDYFAASFPSASAYKAEFLTDEEVEQLSKLPIWLIHAQDDPVTKADETATPTYQRLIAAGAQDVHYSLYDHVVDITGFFGGDNFHYMGHFSWIYCHANECRLDYDGSPVTVNDKPVTIMEWLATKRR